MLLRAQIGTQPGKLLLLRAQIGTQPGKLLLLRAQIGTQPGKLLLLRAQIGTQPGKLLLLRAQIGTQPGKLLSLRAQIGTQPGKVSPNCGDILPRGQIALHRTDRLGEGLSLSLLESGGLQGPRGAQRVECGNHGGSIRQSASAPKFHPLLSASIPIGRPTGPNSLMPDLQPDTNARTDLTTAAGHTNVKRPEPALHLEADRISHLPGIRTGAE